MFVRLSIYVLVAFLLAPVWGQAADAPDAAAETPPAEQAIVPEPPAAEATTGADEARVFAENREATFKKPYFLKWGSIDPRSEGMVRFGGWGMWTSGSPAKTGEYQDLSPSPFWDVDWLASNGTRTLDVTATGTDNETTRGRVYYFQPGLTAKIGYDRYLHRLDHDDFGNMGTPAQVPPGTTSSTDPKIIAQDLNVGKDYVLRVQELKGSFKAVLTEGVKVRLDYWRLEKDGYRQTNAVAKCYANTNNPNAGSGTPPAALANLPPDHPPLTTFGGNRCHVLSQSQRIDWITNEIKPAIEIRLGDMITVEYSRPMRDFTAADQTVGRYYDRVGVLSYDPASAVFSQPISYADVPNSSTQMDQLKISGDLTEDTKAYAYLMVGTTGNRAVEMNRYFNNVDMRVTNRSIDNTTLTGYGTIFNESEEKPLKGNLAPEDQFVRSSPASPTERLVTPIGYHKSTTGMKGVWRPGGRGFGLGGLALLGGYEYGDLERSNAIFTSSDKIFTVDDSRTITHSFQVGPDYRWSPQLDTYVRYKFQNAVQPLTGFKVDNGVFNTMLPQHDHIVEVGLNWVPSERFIFNASVGIERADNHSQYANFDEENYPLSFSAWYAATQRWSLSAGYAVYSNFVAQNVIVGDDPLPYTTNAAGAYTAGIRPVNSPWKYGGEAHVVTLGSAYAATERLTLTGLVEWVRGRDAITNSTVIFPKTSLIPAGASATDLGTYSEVVNETTRISVGADYLLRPRVVTYCRYELYNFNDIATGDQTGLAQGILGGFTAIF